MVGKWGGRGNRSMGESALDQEVKRKSKRCHRTLTDEATVCQACCLEHTAIGDGCGFTGGILCVSRVPDLVGY